MASQPNPPTSAANFGQWKEAGVGCGTTLSITGTGTQSSLGGATPTITAGTATGTATACVGSASGNQTFTVSGSDLTASLTATAPTGFEISTNAASGFVGTVTLTQTSGSVASTTLYVRTTSAATAGPKTGNVSLASTGATTQNVAVSATVNALPTLSVAANPSLTICLGSSTQLTASGTGTSYLWSTGVTTAAISTTLGQAFSVTATASGCQSTTTVTTVRRSLPTASVNATPSLTICSGQSVTLTATGNAGSPGARVGVVEGVQAVPVGPTFQWSTGVTGVSTTFTPTSNTVITVTASDGFCTSAPVSTSITVKLTPTVSASANPATITSGQSSNLTASGATTYVWTGNQTTNPLTVNPTATTPYSVTGTTNGCSATATTTVTVNTATPTITAGTVTGTITACAGTASVSPAVQQFTVSGSNLTANIVATAPAGFEVSTNATAGFGATVTLTQSGGSVSSTIIYVRSAATATGSISGNVSLASSGATTQNVAVSGTITASSPDYQPLVDLYNATNGSGWTNKSGWLTGCTPCGWYGVTCNGNGRVTRLSLGDNQLSGSLPLSLSALNNLQSLDLSINQLSGSIPGNLNVLTNLQQLYLNSNQLTGSIPGNLSVLTNLTNLYLNRNQLTGSIPGSLSALTNLKELALSNNQLSGSIPASLSALTALQQLYLFNNQLSGTIPASLGALTNLGALYLDGNQLSGCYAASLSAFCALGANKDFSNNSGLPDGGSAAGFTAFCTTGLSSNLAISITPNPSLTIVQGGSTQLTASGADTYRWSTNSTGNPITVSTAGPYSVTGTTTAGCSNTATATVSVTTAVPTQPVIAAVGAATVCQGTALTIAASTGCSVGTFTYIYASDDNPSETLATPADGKLVLTLPGAYTVAGACGTPDGGIVPGTVPTQILVQINTNPTATITGGNVAICAGQSLTLGTQVNFQAPPSQDMSLSPYRYAWSPAPVSQNDAAGTAIVQPLTTTAYTVKVTDANNCSVVSAPVSVTVNSLPSLTITASPSLTIIQGGSTQLTASGADTYRWSTSSTGNPITVSTAGPYSVTGTTTAGCSNTATATVTVASVFSVGLTASPTTILTTGSTTLTALPVGGTSPFSYTFSGPGTITPSGNTATVSGLSAGVQTFTVVARDGTSPTSQTASRTVSVTVNTPCPTYTATLTTTTTTPVCAGTPVTINFAVSISNSVLDGVPSLLSLSKANDNAQRSSVNGVTSVNTPSPTVAYSFTYSDGTSTTAASAAANTGTSFVVSPTTGKTYTLVAVKDAAGCPATTIGAPVSVTVNQLPTVANAGSSQSIAQGNYPSLQANTAIVGTGTWTASIPGTFGGVNSAATSFTPTNPAASLSGSYGLTWTISNGACPPSSNSLTITVVPATTLLVSLSASPTTITTTGSTTLTATPSGGTSPLSYTFTGPGTITPNGNVAVVSGVPAGLQTFTVVVRDATLPSSQTVSQTALVTVLIAPTTTGIPNQVSLVGASFSLNIAPFFTSYNGALRLAVSGLPAGLGFDNGTISGVPQASGASSITVVATDAANLSVSTIFTLTVGPAPVIILTVALSATPRAIQTNGTTTLQAAASGGKGPYTYTFSGPGTISQSGNTATVSGLPVGVHTFSVVAFDSDPVTQQRATNTVSVTVTAVPVVVPALSLTATASPTTLLTSGTTTLSATVSGGTPGYTYTFSGPGTITPNGNTATVSGLPVGVQSFTITVRDATVPGNQVVSQTVSVTVTAVPVVVPTLSLTATASPTTLLTSGTTTLSATVSGGTPGYTYTFSGPGTITPNGNTATVSGLPVGVQSFTITVRDATVPGNQVVSQTVSVTVTAVPVVVPALSLTATASPTTLLTSGTTTLSATVSGGTPGYTYTFSGPGTITPNGNTAIVSGLSTGVQTFTIVARDATIPGNQVVSQTVSVTVSAVSPPPVSVPFSATVLSYNCQTGAMVVGNVGAPGSGPVEYAIPGLTNYTSDANFTLNIGQLRDASTITINVRQGVVQGTPFVFNFRAFCQGGGQPTPTPTPPTTTGIPNQTGTAGSSFSLNLSPFFTSFNGALSFAASGLPAGLSVSGSVLGGTPAASGVSSVTITATDAGGLSVRTSFVFTINAAGTPPPATVPFSATVLSYNCTTGALLVGSVGAPGSGPVEYAIPGLTNYTSDANFTLNIGQLRDASTITINVRQGVVQGTPFVFNFRAFCQGGGQPTPTPTPPTTTGIPNQAGTAGSSFSLNLSPFFTSFNGALSFAASGLPAGLSVSGSVLGGTPAASGVSSVTITATDAGGLSVRTSFVFTINAAGTPPPVTVPFSATVLSYNCQTGALLVGSVGIPGSGPVEYAIPGLTNYTSDANFTLNIGQLRDASTITINVRQGVVQGTPFVFNFRAFCQGGGQPTPVPTPTPTPTPVPTPPASVPFSATVLSYNCQTGALLVGSVGIPGSGPVEYAIPGLTNYTTSANFVLNIGQLRDASTITVNVRQGATQGTPFVFNFRAFCQSQAPARLGTGQETGSGLTVTVLGNPSADAATVEIGGAAGQSLVLRLMDVSGRQIERRSVAVAEVVERQTFDLRGQPSAVLLLEVVGSSERQTVRLLRE